MANLRCLSVHQITGKLLELGAFSIFFRWKSRFVVFFLSSSQGFWAYSKFQHVLKQHVDTIYRYDMFFKMGSFMTLLNKVVGCVGYHYSTQFIEDLEDLTSVASKWPTGVVPLISIYIQPSIWGQTAMNAAIGASFHHPKKASRDKHDIMLIYGWTYVISDKHGSPSFSHRFSSFSGIYIYIM